MTDPNKDFFYGKVQSYSEAKRSLKKTKLKVKRKVSAPIWRPKSGEIVEVIITKHNQELFKEYINDKMLKFLILFKHFQYSEVYHDSYGTSDYAVFSCLFTGHRFKFPVKYVKQAQPDISNKLNLVKGWFKTSFRKNRFSHPRTDFFQRS